MKTIRPDTKVGKNTLRLVQTSTGYVGVLINAQGTLQKIEGDDPDDVWRRLHDEVGKSSPRYFGYPGAIARFTHFFPAGFEDAGYAEQERNYKLAAKAKLDATVPLEEALSKTGLGEPALAAFRSTNLLSPFEKTRLQSVLRGPTADAFVQGAARFAMGETKSGLAAMAAALRSDEAAKWTVVTYLPYLWRPDEHMFLKPEATNDFAERVGHRFARDYEARLDIDVYESLLDLTRETEKEIASLKPQDRIDAQSFIWVVGSYDDPVAPGESKP